jgi:glutaredoxin
MIKKYLDYKGIEYEEVNLDDHPERREEATRLSGAVTLPITIVKKQDNMPKVVIGYNLAKLAPALA